MNNIKFISEIGINHNGSLDDCKKMIMLSKIAGCDYVKIQKRNPDICVPEHQKNVIRKTPWGEMTYLEYKYKLEFTENQIQELFEYSNTIGIQLFASVWDIDSVHLMSKYTNIVKLGSPVINDLELLKATRKAFDYVIMSSGMSTEEEIEKYELDDYQTTFTVNKNNGNNELKFSDKGFIGFFVGQHEFTIECYDSKNILVRSVDNQNVAWYVWLTDQEISTTPSHKIYTNLVWSDEFNYNGKLDSNKWVYEIRNQWYNQELQATTDRLDNVLVENGVLKIIAKRENYGGKQFSSGRVKTNKKFDFTYGRVDIRAKLPGKKGTWPALWLLGSNYDQIDWPKCGELDIMEHAGNRLNKIQATAHHPDNYGSGDGGATYDYDDVSTEFHVYSIVWTEKGMTFLVDDKPYHIVGNACSLPFNWDFFIIVNIAMGGTFGGNVPSDFVSDTMEVDYVRVYQ